MVVSGCPPSLHWERHQLLGLRMAIGVVLCEIGDTPASSISSHLPPRYRYWPLLTVTKLHSFFFTAVAVSGTIGYLTGYNFVGSSCVEVPAANLSHALGFFFIRLLSVHILILICWLLPRCRVGRQLLSRRAVLQFPVSCASDTCPSCCLSPLRRTRTFFILCAFLLSMWSYVFLVRLALIGVPPTKSYSFTGNNVYRFAKRPIEVQTAYDRAIGSPHYT